MSVISPFTNVLRTNYVPTPVEIGAIGRMLEGPNAELQALEDQLFQLQKQLKTKTTKRDNLSKSIAEHHNLLSPFRCLPDDILSEIFMACLPTAHEATMECNEPPLILGYVCRRWRSVAYNTPRLWATLHIAIPSLPTFHEHLNDEVASDFKRTFEQKIQYHQIRISTWLSYSKACPLSISIHDPRIFSSMSYISPAKSYYNLVFNFSDRIWRLNLNVLNHQSTSYLLATIPFTSFPRLRVLFLEIHRGLRRCTGTDKWGNSGSLNAPNLTCMRLSMCTLHFEEMNVDWSHLTHIVVSGAGGSLRRFRLNISNAHKIFTHCPRLHFCVIEILGAKTMPITYTPFSLPYLHTLSVIDGSTGLDDLFQYADIPSLRNLTYHSTLCPAFDQRSPLLVILSRTNSKLKRLTINIQLFTLVDLVECFDMVPLLTHLTNIDCCYAGDFTELPVSPKILSALLQLLTPADDRHVYLPNLQVINFDSRGMDIYLSDWELLNFIRCRMDNASRKSDIQVAALTEISVVSMNKMEVDIRPYLQEYSSNGMKLHLTYHGMDSPPPPSLVYTPYKFNEVQIFQVDKENYL